MQRIETIDQPRSEAAAAGLKASRLTCHSRATTITNLLDQGVSLDDVQ
jgi:hypothetical protein